MEATVKVKSSDSGPKWTRVRRGSCLPVESLRLFRDLQLDTVLFYVVGQ